MQLSSVQTPTCMFTGSEQSHSLCLNKVHFKELFSLWIRAIALNVTAGEYQVGSMSLTGSRGIGSLSFWTKFCHYWFSCVHIFLLTETLFLNNNEKMAVASGIFRTMIPISLSVSCNIYHSSTSGGVVLIIMISLSLHIFMQANACIPKFIASEMQGMVISTFYHIHG